jgi:hypothetical protein
MSVFTDPPAVLPVQSLSLSSINLLRKCPEKWRRRYLENEYEPPSGPMIVGSAAGAAENRSLQQKITSGEDLAVADVLDAYADEWHERADSSDVAWGDAKPEKLRDAGQAALTVYHEQIAPEVRPTSVERKFTLRFDGLDWTFTGYLDLEEADGSVGDLKVKGRRLSQGEANVDPQVSAYLLARRAEANPAGEFRFHTMIRTAKPSAEIVHTTRTDGQLDAFLHRIFAAAQEIHWRASNDLWDAAPPGSWWCQANSCGHWRSCPFGGQHAAANVMAVAA